MCYAAPGPRCSAHARARLDRAEAAYEQATQAYEAAANEAAERGEEFDYAHRLGSDLGMAHEAQQQAAEALTKARAEWLTTPKGIRSLKDQAAVMRDELGAKAGEDPNYQALVAEIENNQRIRAEQRVAYKRIHGDTAVHMTAPNGVIDTPVEPDSEIDELAAQGAVPRCNCIDYRWKQTCTHLVSPQEKARMQMVPTGLEASMALHEANAAVRAAKARLADARTGEEVAAAARDVTALSRQAKYATQVFDSTPEGQRYLRHKIALNERLGGGALTPLTYTLRERADVGAQYRKDMAAQYTATTGLAVPKHTLSGPPPRRNFSDCTCEEFAWTGTCGDVDPDVRHERMQTALKNVSLAYQRPQRRGLRAALGRVFARATGRTGYRAA